MNNLKLLILFGHENDLEGHLSPIAIARCERALEIALTDARIVILPTGAFGDHFNKSRHSHGLLLTRYLVEKGFQPDKILPATNSSGTLEDALCARKVVIEGKFSDVIAVTSDYHMPRVRYIVDRVFQDLSLSLTFGKPVLTNEVIRKKEEKKEEASFNKLIDEWVNIPLYCSNAPFPEQVYENAAAEQKHYDTISLALVTGILGVSTVPYFSKLEKIANLDWAPFLAAAFIDIVLLLMYERAAETARTARRIMHYIEIAFDKRGFSANYLLQGFYGRLPGIKQLVRGLSIALIIVLVVTALCLGFGPPPIPPFPGCIGGLRVRS